MYKVMLVDDEKLILNGIKQIIDWEALELEVVATANNGEEAIEAFKQNPVHIIVTDINMPKVNGLTMIKAIKEIKQDVKFIILSGHDEFSYAKEAIKLDVEGYILKPIDEEELERLLQDTIQKIRTIDVHRSDLIDKHTQVLRFLDGEEALASSEGLLNVQSHAQYYSIASLILDTTNESKKISEAIKLIEKKNISFFPQNNQLEIFYDMNSTLVLMNSWDEKNDLGITDYYRSMQQVLKEKMNICSFLTLGEKVLTREGLPRAYKVVKQLEKYILVRGYGSLVDAAEMTELPNAHITIDADRLYKSIIEANQEQAASYLEKVFEEIRQSEVSVENIYEIAMKLVVVLQEVIGDFKLEKRHNIKGISELLAAIYTAQDFIMLKNIFLEEVEEIIQLINEKEKRYTPVVQQVVNYIHENYWEDMNLKTLAYKYNINTSYLGQIFLKEVGCSFSQYLSNIKNSKAKELILTTNMKINDIAKEVGYTDTSYFYRKFKKHYGVSPATLREIKKYS